MAKGQGPIRPNKREIGGKALPTKISKGGRTPMVPERTRRGNQPGIK